MLAPDAHCCDCVLPRCKNSEHTRDSFRGKCSTIVPSFFTATAYRSEEILGSLSHVHQCLSNRWRPYFFTVAIRGSRECNFFRKTFPWQLLSPYVLPDFYVVKFSCWNIFVGCRPYKNFSTRKFFQWKFHITKISQFTVATLFAYFLAWHPYIFLLNLFIFACRFISQLHHFISCISLTLMAPEESFDSGMFQSKFIHCCITSTSTYVYICYSTIYNAWFLPYRLFCWHENKDFL